MFKVITLAIAMICGTTIAKADCGHVAHETYYFQGTESPDYFVLQHDFAAAGYSDTVWALTYCLSLDDGHGGVVDYARTKYFYADSTGALVLDGQIDDNPSYIADFDHFPLSYTDVNFSTLVYSNPALDAVRFKIGLNDGTIVATFSASMRPFQGTCH